MLVKRWVVTEGFHKGAKVELFRESNGKYHCVGRTRTGTPYKIGTAKEARKIIDNFRMVCVEI